jgi:type 1 glutamine amidotransferase
VPIRTLLLGGMTRAYHEFWKNGVALREVLEAAEAEVYMSEALEVLASPELGQYAVVANLSTGRRLTAAEEAGLLAFVRQGGGLLGVHNATDTFTDSPAYVAAIGGRFVRHPEQLDIHVAYPDPEHPLVRGIPPFTVRDELYIMDWDPGRVELLAATRSYGDQETPIAWVRREGQGRVFYISLGHNLSTYAVPEFRALVGRGLRWCAGGEPGA